MSINIDVFRVQQHCIFVLRLISLCRVAGAVSIHDLSENIAVDFAHLLDHIDFECWSGFPVDG